MSEIEQKKTGRIGWIDYGKVFAIYLVMLAHTKMYTPLTSGIYTFLMPFFFFLSGFLFSFERNPEYKPFVAKRFRQLIIPYFWINLITYLFWFFVTSKTGDDAGTPIAWYSPIISALLAYGKGMVHDVPLWFFVCLFVIENLFYACWKVGNKWILLPVMFGIAYLNYTFNPIRLPFSFSTALTGIAFYTFGFICRNSGVLNRLTGWYWFVAALLAVIVVTHFNGRIAMYNNAYGNFGLFIIGGFSGIIMMYNLAFYIHKLSGDRHIISHISSNTLLISGFHLAIFSCIKGVMVYLLHIPLSVLDQGIGANILFTFIGFLLCLPLIKFVNRYVPFIVGKKYGKNSAEGVK